MFEKKTYFCPKCGHRHQIHSKIGINHVVPKGSHETVSNSVEAARRHHAVHGDMGGVRGECCLLLECALHYPKALYERMELAFYGISFTGPPYRVSRQNMMTALRKFRREIQDLESKVNDDE